MTQALPAPLKQALAWLAQERQEQEWLAQEWLVEAQRAGQEKGALAPTGEESAAPRPVLEVGQKPVQVWSA